MQINKKIIFCAFFNMLTYANIVYFLETLSHATRKKNIHITIF